MVLEVVCGMSCCSVFCKSVCRPLTCWDLGVRIPPGAWIFVCCECRVLSGRGLCDELITHPEESYRLCCVVVCDLETSRMGAPYIYDISRLRVNVDIIFLSSFRQMPKQGMTSPFHILHNPSLINRPTIWQSYGPKISFFCVMISSYFVWRSHSYVVEDSKSSRIRHHVIGWVVPTIMKEIFCLVWITLEGKTLLFIQMLGPSTQWDSITFHKTWFLIHIYWHFIWTRWLHLKVKMMVAPVKLYGVIKQGGNNFNFCCRANLRS